MKTRLPLLRIAVTGPESSGKSTLCAALATRLQTNWVAEYGRTWLEQNGQVNVHSPEELILIAKGQIAAEETAAANANKYLIVDTDLHNLRIWSETLYNHCPRKILETIAAHTYHLYLLTVPDIPWEPDPLRSYPSLRDRHYFYQQYLDAVCSTNVPFQIISGTHETRLTTALKAISQIQNRSLS